MKITVLSAFFEGLPSDNGEDALVFPGHLTHAQLESACLKHRLGSDDTASVGIEVEEEGVFWLSFKTEDGDRATKLQYRAEHTETLEP